MQLKPGGNAVQESFKIQWHVTCRCNLACLHCYEESGGCKEPDFRELLDAYGKIRDFFTGIQTGPEKKRPCHLSITGGEPFARPDFFSLLEQAAKDNDLFRFSILTNGTLVTASLAAKLKTLSPAYVQISVEGPEEIHDRIRGRGSYRMAVEGAKHLIRESIPVSFSVTLHRVNRNGFPHVARLARKLGVRMVWSDRLVPFGRAGENGLERVTEDELSAFHLKMVEERKSADRSFFSKTRVSMHRALQFHEGGGRPYRCQAGNLLLAIDPQGTVYPCRRMPVGVGNIFESSLSEIYRENKFLARLRGEESIPEGCRACFYSKLCRGGLRCLSYAVWGDPFRKDPDCSVTDDR